MNGIRFSILIVDDDPEDRFIIDEAFVEIGYAAEVKKFIDGDAMMRYLGLIDASLYPSVIVLDNAVLHGDTSDLLSVLKTNPEYNAIPVIIYSSSISPATKEKLLSAGAYSCIEKGELMRDVLRVATQLKELARENSVSKT